MGDPRPRIDYDERLHRTYAHGRRLLPETCVLWSQAARRHVGDRDVRRALDLGCGTGRFAPLLADTFGTAVVGVELAGKMRAVAVREAAHPRVRYLAGRAEQVPLREGTVDLVWMSMVVHHLPDLAAVAHEVRRVLRPGGVALVRNSFQGRLAGVATFYGYFPDALEADEARLPSLEGLVGALEGAGLALRSHEVVRQVIDRSLVGFLGRMRERAVSSFDLISEDAYQAGIAALARDAAREASPAPVTEDVDLLGFA